MGAKIGEKELPLNIACYLLTVLFLLILLEEWQMYNVAGLPQNSG
jgi:hypothetical protein